MRMTISSKLSKETVTQVDERETKRINERLLYEMNSETDDETVKQTSNYSIERMLNFAKTKNLDENSSSKNVLRDDENSSSFSCSFEKICKIV